MLFHLFQILCCPIFNVLFSQVENNESYSCTSIRTQSYTETLFLEKRELSGYVFSFKPYSHPVHWFMWKTLPTTKHTQHCISLNEEQWWIQATSGWRFKFLFWFCYYATKESFP